MHLFPSENLWGRVDTAWMPCTAPFACTDSVILMQSPNCCGFWATLFAHMYRRRRDVKHLLAPTGVTDPPRRVSGESRGPKSHGLDSPFFLSPQGFTNKPCGRVASVLAIPLRIRHIRDAKPLMSPATRRLSITSPIHDFLLALDNATSMPTTWRCCRYTLTPVSSGSYKLGTFCPKDRGATGNNFTTKNIHFVIFGVTGYGPSWSESLETQRSVNLLSDKKMGWSRCCKHARGTGANGRRQLTVRSTSDVEPPLRPHPTKMPSENLRWGAPRRRRAYAGASA